MAIIILIFIILATICLCAHAYKSSLEMQENNIIKNMEEYACTTSNGCKIYKVWYE